MRPRGALSFERLRLPPPRKRSYPHTSLSLSNRPFIFKSLRTIFALRAKRVSKVFCHQGIAHSFSKHRGVGDLYRNLFKKNSNLIQSQTSSLDTHHLPLSFIFNHLQIAQFASSLFSRRSNSTGGLPPRLGFLQRSSFRLFPTFICCFCIQCASPGRPAKGGVQDRCRCTFTVLRLRRQARLAAVSFTGCF